MRFNYAGGVLPHEKLTIEHFENQVVPYLEKHGSRVGEMAVKGDLDAEEVIVRYNGVVNGHPAWRGFNFKKLCAALKRWETKARQ